MESLRDDPTRRAQDCARNAEATLAAQCSEPREAECFAEKAATSENGGRNQARVASRRQSAAAEWRRIAGITIGGSGPLCVVNHLKCGGAARSRSRGGDSRRSVVAENATGVLGRRAGGRRPEAKREQERPLPTNADVGETTHFKFQSIIAFPPRIAHIIRPPTHFSTFIPSVHRSCAAFTAFLVPFFFACFTYLVQCFWLPTPLPLPLFICLEAVFFRYLAARDVNAQMNFMLAGQEEEEEGKRRLAPLTVLGGAYA